MNILTGTPLPISNLSVLWYSSWEVLLCYFNIELLSTGLWFVVHHVQHYNLLPSEYDFSNKNSENATQRANLS